MKTTIEMNGFEIVIEETDGLVTVSALKDGETVEEFTLESEGSEIQDDLEGEEDELKAFGEEEDDFEGDEEVESDEDDLEEVDEDEDEDEVEEFGKMESFESFVKKMK